MSSNASTVAGAPGWTHDSWFARYPELAQRPVFILHLRLGVENGCEVGCTIRAYEGHTEPTGHTRLYCELTYGTRSAAQRSGTRGRHYTRKVLFPRAAFYVGTAPHVSIDSDDAKELVLSLFALKPGDTDADFFAHYTPEQLAFVERWGETISMIALDRYGER